LIRLNEVPLDKVFKALANYYNVCLALQSEYQRSKMNGICFDFSGGGEDFVHIAATEGQRLILLKHAFPHTGASEEDRFIVPPAYLFMSRSEYRSVQLSLTPRFGRLLIATEDYAFEGVFETIEGTFPNYRRVIPKATDTTQWFTLCADSFRKTVDSVKGMLGKEGSLYLHAENPNCMKVSVEGSPVMLEVEGTASRPMRVGFKWRNVSACLFDSLPLTKCNLDGVRSPVFSREARPAKGVSLDTTKVFMPCAGAKADDEDAFGMPAAVTEQTAEKKD